MTYSRTLIVLAKSNKHGGYCIAGKDFKTGKWVRPVKDTPFTGDELCNLSNRTDPIKTLDIVQMTFIEENPEVHQPENELVDINVKWRYLGEFQVESLDTLKDGYQNDLLHLVKNSFIRKNYVMNLNLQNSLQLIKITNSNDARIIYQEGYFKNKYKPRLLFEYEGNSYNLPITDSTIPNLKQRKDPKIIENAYITIGIGEEFNYKHYILVVMLKQIELI